MNPENIDFVPSNNFNSSGTIGQQNSNLASTDLLQSFQDNFHPSGSFSTPTLEEIATVDVIETAIPENFAERVSEYNYSPAKDSNFYDEWNHPDSFTGNTAKTLDIDATDSLMKGFSTSEEAVLEVAVFQVQDKLTTFADKKTFFGELNQAFDLDVTSSEARALIEDLATGETMPKIEIVSPTELNNAHGAFGKGFIYISEKFLSDNISKPREITFVLLEEIGHFVDKQLSSGDSPGDEGNIFAQLVQGETISGAELTTLKAEDDSALIFLSGKELAVELAENPRQADAQDGWTSISDSDSPSYPGYNLIYNPSAPEYNEDPEVVRLWQQRMADLGYEIEVDGYYGEQSAGVAREFQEDNGLKVDGYVGPKTWAASFNSATPSYPGYNLIYNPSAPEYNLVRDFANEQFINKGMVADVAFHNLKTHNPHAHIMLTMREISKEGFGKKNREWNKRELIQEQREAWARHVNRALEKARKEERVDHRSLEAQGINRIPQIHLGANVNAMRKRGISTDRWEKYLSIEKANQEIENLEQEISVTSTIICPQRTFYT